VKALVANSLLTGDVVFWNKGRWVERFGDAELFDGEFAAAAEATAKGQATTVVDAYLIDLMDADGVQVPVSYRERIRALGPTNIPEHGKQAEGGAVVEALQHASGAARSSGRLDLIRRK
jgi:sulfite reductase (NADPH) hemoprotein beta-component